MDNRKETKMIIIEVVLQNHPALEIITPPQRFMIADALLKSGTAILDTIHALNLIEGQKHAHSSGKAHPSETETGIAAASQSSGGDTLPDNPISNGIVRKARQYRTKGVGKSKDN